MNTHFDQMAYCRPDPQQIRLQASAFLETMKSTDDADVFEDAFYRFDTLLSHVDTMYALCYVRHTVDTSDEFYDKENDLWDEETPIYEELHNALAKLMLSSPLREEMEKRLPLPYFLRAQCDARCFDEKVVPLLQEENRLCSRYDKLLASAEIELDGKTYNLSGLRALTQSADREMRRKAHGKMADFFLQNETVLDEIFDRLVQVRTAVAQGLGLKDFTELGYLRMGRLDYDRRDVAYYRKQVLAHVVPLAEKLFTRQTERLGYRELRYYDENFEFLSGNPMPHGTADQLVDAAQEMYDNMSPQTGDFFRMMRRCGLMDLVTKPKKAGGGYCITLADYKVPFIFSNFNGTAADVDVLTHEAGHAFQTYCSNLANIRPSGCMSPTMESCEIHSMSMEFLAWPWTKLFFGPDTDKYHFLHLSAAVKFIPYGVLVDHFQHEIYANPQWTPAQRKTCWRELEKQYLPHKDYRGCSLLERGGWWFRQSHIFTSPFYYIDYTLAQVCALQFWQRAQQKDPQTWPDYVHLCSLGGTKTFRDLLAASHLDDPFKEGCLQRIMDSVADYLNGVDDRSL